MCVLLFWLVCWTSTICPSFSCSLWADICEQHEGVPLPSGFLLVMADGKHLQETGGQKATEVSLPHPSSKGLTPYQESSHTAHPAPKTRLFLAVSGLGMVTMAAFISPRANYHPSSFTIPCLPFVNSTLLNSLQIVLTGGCHLFSQEGLAELVTFR